jgi:ribosomal protein S6
MADRQYELIYVLPPETAEQQANELHEQVAQIVARLNGQIEKTENWGRRLKVIDQVIRHMLVRVDEEKRVVDRTRTKRQTESERRRVKRGLPPQRQPGEGRSQDNDDDGDDRFDGVEV